MTYKYICPICKEFFNPDHNDVGFKLGNISTNELTQIYYHRECYKEALVGEKDADFIKSVCNTVKETERRLKDSEDENSGGVRMNEQLPSGDTRSHIPHVALSHTDSIQSEPKEIDKSEWKTKNPKLFEYDSKNDIVDIFVKEDPDCPFPFHEGDWYHQGFYLKSFITYLRDFFRRNNIQYKVINDELDDYLK